MSHSGLVVLSGNHKHGRIFGREKVIERSFQLQANDVTGFAGVGAGSQHCPAVTVYNKPEPPSRRLPARNIETSLL
jgi:hypothetical protein